MKKSLKQEKEIEELWKAMYLMAEKIKQRNKIAETEFWTLMELICGLLIEVRNLRYKLDPHSEFYFEKEFPTMAQIRDGKGLLKLVKKWLKEQMKERMKGRTAQSSP